jgi:CHAD domain-containing protein
MDNPLNLSTNNKRKRNRIFDSSSIKRTKERSKTPEKLKQEEVQSFKLNTERENRDLSPQVKALAVLDKIVDQMGPNSQLSSKLPSKRANWQSDLP